MEELRLLFYRPVDGLVDYGEESGGSEESAREEDQDQEDELTDNYVRPSVVEVGWNDLAEEGLFQMAKEKNFSIQVDRDEGGGEILCI